MLIVLTMLPGDWSDGQRSQHLANPPAKTDKTAKRVWATIKERVLSVSAQLSGQGAVWAYRIVIWVERLSEDRLATVEVSHNRPNIPCA